MRETGKKQFTPKTQDWFLVGDKTAVAERLKAYGELSAGK